MMQKTLAFALICVVVLMLLAGSVSAQQAEDTDKTLSPYFFVRSEDPEVDRLPLKSTSVNVDLAGVIADVTVTQVYRNEGQRPIEAVYVFPASTKAAVCAMKMTIGERIITAQIREREQARHEYEQAKQEGRSASLLEQQRPNVFQMNVANILPSDVIEVELKYIELLVPTDKVYEFVYPTVVGPRYVGASEGEARTPENWVANPYLHEGEPPPYTFDIALNLAAGVPIKQAISPSHKVNIRYKDASRATVTLDPDDQYGGNRDFVFRYTLSGGRIETGLLLYEGEKENFFLVMMQPPKRITEKQIPAREYIFIVDVSGSMHGFPLNISKKLLKDLIGNLRPNDMFNVLLFAGGSSIMSERSLPASSANIQRAITMIENQRGGGGTELLPALQRALSLPRPEGFSRTVVIATDGYVTVEKEAFDLIRAHLGDANMFPFGIGSSVNRYIIEGMARAGMGEPFIITRPEEAGNKAEAFRKLIQTPVLTGIRLDFGKFQAYDVEPPAIPDVLAERPVIVFGKWRGKPEGNIRIEGIAGSRPFKEDIPVKRIKPLRTNQALRYLWARHRIALLSDYNSLAPTDERVKEVTALGLTYNLLTAYTSFVAIDKLIRVKDAQATQVVQPLPLPQGVSDLAVGGNAYGMARTKHFAAPTPWQASLRAAKEEVRQDKDGRLARELKLPEAETEKGCVEIEEVKSSQGLSEKAVMKSLKAQLRGIEHCYREALKKDSNLKGKMTLEVSIDASGRVLNAKVKVMEDQLKDKTFETCLVRELRALLFPAPEQGKEVRVTIVLRFKQR
jgi:Ca-activated chloride channel family protein